MTIVGPAAEAHVAPLIPELIECLSDKVRGVQVAADAAIKALVAALSPHALRLAVSLVLPECDGKWQGNLGRAEVLGALAARHPIQMARHLTEVRPDTRP